MTDAEIEKVANCLRDKYDDLTEKCDILNCESCKCWVEMAKYHLVEIRKAELRGRIKELNSIPELSIDRVFKRLHLEEAQSQLSELEKEG